MKCQTDLGQSWVRELSSAAENFGSKHFHFRKASSVYSDQVGRYITVSGLLQTERCTLVNVNVLSKRTLMVDFKGLPGSIKSKAQTEALLGCRNKTRAARKAPEEKQAEPRQAHSTTEDTELGETEERVLVINYQSSNTCTAINTGSSNTERREGTTPRNSERECRLIRRWSNNVHWISL